MGCDGMKEKRRNLSKEKILTTALDMLKKATYKDEISMRKLSTELGVQASALYWYYKNKEELIHDATEEIFSQINYQSKLLLSERNLLELSLLYYRTLKSYPFIIDVITAPNYQVGEEHLMGILNFQQLLMSLGVEESNAYLGMINFHSYLIGSLHSTEMEYSIRTVFDNRQISRQHNISQEDLYKQGIELWQKGLLKK